MNFITLVIAFLIYFNANAQTFKLALNWKAEPEFGGFYSAQYEGIFKRYGIDLEILEGGSGTPTIQMLATEKVDFAIVSAEEIVLWAERDSKKPVRAIFSVFQKSPYVIMTHASRNFISIQEVLSTEGLLAIQSGLPFFQFLVKKYGRPKVKVVPHLGGVGNFLQNPKLSQQGFLFSEPILAEKAGAKVKTFLVADEGFNPYLVVVAVSEKTLRAKPELVKRFSKAVREGWEIYLKDATKTNQGMAKINKAMDFETFQKGAESQKALIAQEGISLGSMTEDRWKTLISQMRDLNLIRKELKPNQLFINP